MLSWHSARCQKLTAGILVDGDSSVSRWLIKSQRQIPNCSISFRRRLVTPGGRVEFCCEPNPHRITSFTHAGNTIQCFRPHYKRTLLCDGPLRLIPRYPVDNDSRPVHHCPSSSLRHEYVHETLNDQWQSRTRSISPLLWPFLPMFINLPCRPSSIKGGAFCTRLPPICVHVYCTLSLLLVISWFSPISSLLGGELDEAWRVPNYYFTLPLLYVSVHCICNVPNNLSDDCHCNEYMTCGGGTQCCRNQLAPLVLIVLLIITYSALAVSQTLSQWSTGASACVYVCVEVCVLAPL